MRQLTEDRSNYDDLVLEILSYVLSSTSKTSESAAVALIKVSIARAVAWASKKSLLFCEETHDLQCNVTDYPLDCQDGMKISSISEVMLCGICLNQNDPCHQPHCDSYEFRDGRIHIFQIPRNDVDQALKVKYCVHITSLECTAPTEFIECQRELIVEKALSYLFGMKEQEWYSRTSFGDHDLAANRIARNERDRIMREGRGCQALADKPFMKRGPRKLRKQKPWRSTRKFNSTGSQYT